MRVEIEQPGQQTFVLGEVDNAGGGKITAGEIRADFEDDAVADDQAGVADGLIAWLSGQVLRG